MTTKESEVDVSRQQFEEAMRSVWWGDSFHAERHPKAPDEYLKAPEQMAWIGWKAARTQPPSPKEPDMNTTTNTRGVSFTAEQVERQASILSDTWGVGEAYKMLRAYAAALSAEPAAQGEVVDRVAKAIADATGHGMREKCEHMAHAAIAAYQLATWNTAPPAQPAERVPDGWKLVPIDATPAMQAAGGHANSEWLNDNAPIGESRYGGPVMRSVWEAMLAAAPAPSEGGKGVDRE